MSISEAINEALSEVIVTGDPQFAEFLRTARTEQVRLTQAALAERLDVSPPLIGMRESADRRLYIGAAVDHLAALGYRLVIIPAQAVAE